LPVLLSLSALVAFVLGCDGVSAQQPQARLALLIGNQAYNAAVGPLKNPHNDIALIGGALEKLGFKTSLVQDADYRAIDVAIKRHIQSVRREGPGTISFVYYSGHGAADPDTKINYLIPVDVANAEDEDLWTNSVNLNSVIENLRGQAPAATHYVVFDACRNELKLTRKGKKALSDKGFVPIAYTPGVMVAYATAPGQTADDRGAGSGPYAKALADEIGKPGVEAMTMFRRVALRVNREIGQDPWMSASTLPEVYLAGEISPVAPPRSLGLSETERQALLQECRQPGNTNLAIKACGELIERGGAGQEATEGYFLRGMAYARALERGKAQSDFEQVVHFAPKTALAQTARAATLLANVDADGAIETATQAIGLEPSSAPAHVVRGAAHLSKRDSPRALSDLDRAISLDPLPPLPYLHRGAVHLLRGDAELALADFNEAIRRDPNLAQAYLARAGYWRGRDEARAIADYDMALRLKADFAEALSGRAAAQLQRRNWDLALADLERALKIDSARAQDYVLRGRAYGERREWDRAIADFTRAIALGERTALTYIYRGAAYDAKYDYDRAIADYGEALRLEPSNVRAIAARGLAHFNKGNLDAAAFDLSETLKREPTNEVALLTRAMVYSAKGEQARAIGDLDALLRRDAKNASAYVQRGIVLLKQAEPDRAIADLTQAAALGANTRDVLADAYHQRALARIKAEQTDAAIADFGEAIRLAPQLRPAFFERGRAYAKRKDTLLAINDFGEAIRLQPSAAAYSNRGLLYLETKSFDRAIADLDEALSRDKEDKYAVYGRGTAHLEKRDYERAIADLTEAIRLDHPAKADAYQDRGRAHVLQGRAAQGINDLSEAIRLAPGDLRAYNNRGWAYEFSGDKTRAIADFRKALSLDRTNQFARESLKRLGASAER
jgi:tetratricopeptide (TPR) repeat protein